MTSYSWWCDSFSTVQPVGCDLRHAFPDRWLRIYSLPGGRRYASTEDELMLLRKRHRDVTAALFVEGADCRLIVSCTDAGHESFSRFDLAPAPELPAYQPDEDDPPVGPFYAAALAWDMDVFRPVLDAIASDAVRALVVCPATTVAYAPYDGGADLFFPNSTARNQAGQTLRTYASPRPDGL